MTQTAFALIVFLFPLAFSPGPGNLFFAANGARFGFRRTVPAFVGYHLATWLVTAAIGLGFLAAIERFPNLFTGLRIIGSLYVLWLASKMLRSGVVDAPEGARPARFVDGVILLVLNPKAFVIIALMFTQFLEASAVDPLVSVLVISTIFTLNNLVAFSAWTLVGDRIARLFRSRDSARRLNLVFGTILAGVALWMLVA